MPSPLDTVSLPGAPSVDVPPTLSAPDFDASVAADQARLIAFEKGCGASVPSGYGPSDINGQNDDRTGQATKFFQQAFNRTPPPSGYRLIAPLVVDGNARDPNTRLALAFEVEGTPPPAALFAPFSAPAAASSDSSSTAMIAGAVGLALLVGVSMSKKGGRR